MRWIDFLMSSIAFWLAWILIPAIMEIIPAIGNFLILIKKSIDQKEVIELQYYPEIALNQAHLQNQIFQINQRNSLYYY